MHFLLKMRWNANIWKLEAEKLKINCWKRFENRWKCLKIAEIWNESLKMSGNSWNMKLITENSWNMKLITQNVWEIAEIWN